MAEQGHKTSADFEVDAFQPLLNLDLTDSKELWLIQCPLNQFPEIDGGELKINLREDGEFGGFEDSSGKAYDLVSFGAQEVDATVILPSGADSKIVGKISRRVSLVHYPEPEELVEALRSKTHQRFAGALSSSSNQFSTPTQTNRTRPSHSAFRHSAATKSSRHKSALSGASEKPKSSKRKHSDSVGRSNLTESSGRGHSTTTTVLGSSERSGKSPKKIKIEE